MQTRQTTKELIAASFMELAEKKPIDKITVREIAARSGVTAVTFYNHFHDKYDLIVWSYIDYGKSTMQKIGTDGYRWRDTLFEAMRDFAEKRIFLLNALHHTSGHDSFIRHVERVNTDLLTAEVRKSLGAKPLPPAIQYAIEVYCSGTVRTLLGWLMDGMPIPAEELARIFEDCLPPELRGFLYP